jgi:hypothetical protein
MTHRKRDPGEGVTPLDGTQLVFAETGQPVPHEPEPPRQRRKQPDRAPTPPRASVAALHDELFSGRDRAGLDKTFAGIKVRELRTERNALDAELAEVESLMRQHRRLFPDDLVPTGLVARFDRARDAIVANERAMAQVRFTLAPGVQLEHPTPQQQRREQQRRALETALKAARTTGRKEYAAVSGMLDRLATTPNPLVASASRSSHAAARASVVHRDHGTSQHVMFEGRPSMIFTGR